MKKILHITNWYPNEWNNIEAIFIKEQFNLFSKVTNGHLVNVQIREGEKLFEYKYIKYSEKETGYYILTKIKSNKVIELLTSFLLLWVLLKSNYKKYDLLHFHIAYPLLSYYFLWKKIIKAPIILSEHWSAYHYNFYMPKNTKKLDGIKRIFKQNIPLITVSKSLLKDIEKFSGVKTSSSYIIPNVIDTTYYRYKEIEEKNRVPTFFIVNNWRPIKNPFPMLEGFTKLASKKIEFHLVIGGYGELMKDIKQFVDKHKLHEQVRFFGKMNKEQIADQLHHSHAYLFSSNYETFSVVCAQALCCGVPIIGPSTAAVLEYSDKNSFLTLKENSAENWEEKLKFFIKNKDSYNKKFIAEKVKRYLAHESIQKKYQELINEQT